MPRIRNVGEPFIPRKPQARFAGAIRPSREFARLWPEPGWDAEAVRDPWGTALRRACHDRVRALIASWHPTRSSSRPTRNQAMRLWARRVSSVRRAAERLTGDAALACIARGLGKDRHFSLYLNPGGTGNLAVQLHRGEIPFSIAATALLYACVGYRCVFRVHHYRGFYKATQPPAKTCRLDVLRFRRRGRHAPDEMVRNEPFEDMGAAVAAIRRLPAVGRKRLPAPAASFASGFGHCRLRVYPTGNGGAGVGVLLGPKPLRQRILIEAFDSAEAARAALRDPAALRRLQRKFRLWWINGVPRINMNDYLDAIRWGNPRRGPPRRFGDVTAEQFDETFRPRGVSFGASIPQAERQRMINVVFDYACDLAEALGIAPDELFFNRRVSIVFGGRAGRVTQLASYYIAEGRRRSISRRRKTPPSPHGPMPGLAGTPGGRSRGTGA